MKPIAIWAALFAAIFCPAQSSTINDLHQKYVGKSDCITELQLPVGRSGIRLDRKQNAYLTNYKLKGSNILTIVQYQNDHEQCGLIHDVVQSRDTDASFVWDCVDPKAPAAVVVGTWSAQHPAVKGPAKEAWRIDLKELRFVPVERAVNCRAGNYAGSDQGDGLSDWAKERSADRTSK